MQKHTEDKIGIDLLCEISLGWYLTGILDSSGYYVAYRADGTTPVNIMNSHTWLDYRQGVVKREDYTSYNNQIPMPVVSYDLVSARDTAFELGEASNNVTYSLTILVHAENKAQVVNLAGFIFAVLKDSIIPINNYNVIGTPQVGVIEFENLYQTRMYDFFADANAYSNYIISISCDAKAIFSNNYPV